MSLASALVAGNDALPRLAVRAVAQALDKAGTTHANGILLFLTPEFARNAQQAVTAVARAAHCTQVAGGLAAGVFTESGWVLDRPAAAALVLVGEETLAAAGSRGQSGVPLLCYAGDHFPRAWAALDSDLFGGCFTGSGSARDGSTWQQSRLVPHCLVQFGGLNVTVGISSGWRLLGQPLPVDASCAYQLLGVGGQAAAASLQQALGAAGESRAEPAISSLGAVLVEETSGASLDGGYRPIAIIDVSEQGAVTLAERVASGQLLAWAIRLPQAAEDDMRRSIDRLFERVPEPMAAIVFSCMGRGPYFYGGRDRDVDCLRERFPNLPLIGSYGTGQIASRARADRHLLQNAVVTAFLSRVAESIDVQSQS